MDTYRSTSSGEGELCLAGTAPGSAFFAGSRFSTFFHGNLSAGSFTVVGAVVGLSALSPPPALPQALWVRGSFYSQAVDAPGTYKWQPSEGTPFTLTAVSVPGGFEITGTDDVGAVSGLLPVGGGLHFLHAGADSSAPLSVPVHQASAAGVPVTAGQSLSAYPDTPLAVEVAGSVFRFTRLLATPDRAIYVPDDLRSSGRWLTLRLDTQAVELTDHATAPATVTSGSYAPATHLFSTPHGSGSLPEYLHAADPGHDDAHWVLPLPAGQTKPVPVKPVPSPAQIHTWAPRRSLTPMAVNIISMPSSWVFQNRWWPATSS